MTAHTNAWGLGAPMFNEDDLRRFVGRMARMVSEFVEDQPSGEGRGRGRGRRGMNPQARAAMREQLTEAGIDPDAVREAMREARESLATDGRPSRDEMREAMREQLIARGIDPGAVREARRAARDAMFAEHCGPDARGARHFAMMAEDGEAGPDVESEHPRHRDKGPKGERGGKGKRHKHAGEGPEGWPDRGPRGEGGPKRGPRGDGPGGPGGPFGFGPFGGFGPGGFGPGRGSHGRGPGWRFEGGRGRAGRGDVRLAILALLSEGPRHGYQLIQDITERSGGAWAPSPGSIYPALSALQDEGLIDDEKVEGRRVFSLTEAGKAHVAERQAQIDAVFAQNAPTSEHEALAEVGRLMWGVGEAALTVMGSGTEAQRAEARDVLARTRRDLFGILAGEPTTTAAPADAPAANSAEVVDDQATDATDASIADASPEDSENS